MPVLLYMVYFVDSSLDGKELNGMVGVFPTRSGPEILFRLGMQLGFGPYQTLDPAVPRSNGLVPKPSRLNDDPLLQYGAWGWLVSPADWCTTFPGLAAQE